ncbi:predicted protein [Postia placenta Mad-698-R]|nr:predicted protein [Postia placenta Mad-698-R]
MSGGKEEAYGVDQIKVIISLIWGHDNRAVYVDRPIRIVSICFKRETGTVHFRMGCKAVRPAFNLPAVKLNSFCLKSPEMNGSVSSRFDPAYFLTPDPPSFPAASTANIMQGNMCSWNGTCGHNISILPPGPGLIMQHLRERHSENLPLATGDRRDCRWCMADGSLCGKQIISRDFGKHIATVHLKSSAKICARCSRIFSRGDSLRRHLKKCGGKHT